MNDGSPECPLSQRRFLLKKEDAVEFVCPDGFKKPDDLIAYLETGELVAQFYNPREAIRVFEAIYMTPKT